MHDKLECDEKSHINEMKAAVARPTYIKCTGNVCSEFHDVVLSLLSSLLFEVLFSSFDSWKVHREPSSAAELRTATEYD
jgi:hypothetical protein